MNRLFQPGLINGLELKNRFVRSATWEGLADDKGYCTPALTEVLVELARGRVGLIISSHTYVRPDGQAHRAQLGLHDDSRIAALKEMTEAVHAAGGKIVLQLTHAGLRAPEDSAWPVFDLNRATEAEIADLADCYAAAAGRARKAGFDGVQLHGAHGYLINQFMSPAFNRRTDDYGGSVSGRARFCLEVLTKVRTVVGPDFPVLIKINGQDYLDNGLVIDDTVKICALLTEAGLDAIEVSGGNLDGRYTPSRLGISKPEKEAYHRAEAEAIRQAVTIPLILVGGIRSIEVAGDVLTRGAADYVSLCRPLIREPGLIARWQDGDPTPAKCKSDNLCFGPIRAGQGFYCVLDHKENQK